LSAVGSSADRLVQITGDFQTVVGIHFTTASPPPSQKGIVVARTSDLSNPVYGVAVRDCSFTGIPNWNVLVDDSGGRFAVFCEFENLDIRSNGPAGPGCIYSGAVTTTLTFRRCRVSAFSGYAVQIDRTGTVAFHDCIFEGHTSETQPSILLAGTNNVLFDHCYFEGPSIVASPTPGFGEYIRTTASGATKTHGLTLLSCRFMRPGGNFLKAIRMDDQTSGVLIANPLISFPQPTPVGGGEHIIISDSASRDITIVSGTMETDYVQLLISDASNSAAVIGAMRTLRLPGLSATDRGNLLPQYLRIGDLIYNNTSGRVEMVASVSLSPPSVIWVGLATIP
jgi:hypothetical protein